MHRLRMCEQGRCDVRVWFVGQIFRDETDRQRHRRAAVYISILKGTGGNVPHCALDRQEDGTARGSVAAS